LGRALQADPDAPGGGVEDQHGKRVGALGHWRTRDADGEPSAARSSESSPPRGAPEKSVERSRRLQQARRFMRWKGASRLCSRQALERWSERLGQDWERLFPESSLRQGRSLYKSSAIREVSLNDDDAIMTCRVGQL